MQNQAKEIIKSHHLKATPQRINIYNTIKFLGHASADMVYNRVRELFPSLTVATVYNVLETFDQAGLITRRYSSNNKMYFDINTHEHCHLYDKQNNVFYDFDDIELISIVKEHLKRKDIPDFEIGGIDIQLIGHKKNSVE